MKSKVLKTVAGTMLLFFCLSTFAADGAITLLQKGITDALKKIFDDIQAWALGVLGIFILLQFTWTNINLLLNGADLEKVWAKFIGSVSWFGICIYIFSNGPDFIKNVGSYIMNKASNVTGSSFDSMAPIDAGISVASQLLETFDSNQSVLGALNPFPSIMLGIVSIVILAVSALLAFKIFMVFVETKMVIALSPLSFALLGLNAFKDQGLAPLKYLVSMALRMFLYGAVLAAMVVFTTTLITSFKSLPPSSDPSVWPPIWAAAIGYVLLGAVALRVDSIAAMLASGSSQMSTGDSAAVGAIAGAAAGAAIAAATGGASVAASASKVPQSMSEVMRALSGSASLSNASSRGAGSSTELMTADAPVRSMFNGGGGGGGQPPAPVDMQQQIKGDAARTESAMNSVGGNPVAAADKQSRPGSGSDSGSTGKFDHVGRPIQQEPAGSGNTAGGGQTPAPVDMKQQIKGDAARTESAMKSVGGNPVAAADKQSRPGSGSDSGSTGKFDHVGRPIQQEPAGSGNTAGVDNRGGNGSHSSGATNDDVLKALAQQNKPQAKDRMADLKDHVLNDAPAVLISMNTHQE